MTPERYQELTADPKARLSKRELAEGYHFCPDWDFLLIGPGFQELQSCSCKLFIRANYYCSAHDDFNSVRCDAQCTACQTAHGKPAYSPPFTTDVP